MRTGENENAETGGPQAEGSGRERVVIGLISDPDLPELVAQQLADDLPKALADRVSDRVRWQVELTAEPFEAMAPDFDRLIDKARERVRNTNWDFAVCITDVPVRSDNRFVLADVSGKDGVTLISLPALGGLRLRQRARDTVVPIIDFLATKIPRPDGRRSPDVPRLDRSFLEMGHSTSVRKPDDGDVTVEIVRKTGSGIIRLLAGMVRANRPWQLVLGLSTALAGSLAGVAFGLLYSSIWQLATALSPLRMIGVILVAIAALSTWIIAGHSLWERRTLPGGRRSSGTGLRNAGTILTVTLGTVAFFLSLVLLASAAAALIIPPDFLAQNLGRPADWQDYLSVAMMASVLGTVAGAVGSGLEDDQTVRRATYGYREQERWREVTRKGHTGGGEDPQR
ncbi:hypothetical protein SAMN05216266_102401 [Amycolatopsis marina]|uniref:Uncharacterized protein n=1 Tax=Amycolatopsis marina TaxID=490629 RepID=A0A1I0X2M8_9PSEU|nr:hypothetical protein [Amycolatopsis marina]SFA94917.1 hypothetical protein SAMN05216266_102401 [Amycolatopsis marina]